jgi:uncharacterized membrane protein
MDTALNDGSAKDSSSSSPLGQPRLVNTRLHGKDKHRDHAFRFTLATIAIAALHAVVTSVLAIQQHHAFRSYGWDFGIYEQAAWLVSSEGLSSESFISIRGLPLWGHHVNAIFILLAPLVKLGAGARFLIVLQSTVVAFGALPLSWLARSRTGKASVGFAIAVVFLLHPATSWYGFSLFHPENLAVGLLLFAFWFAHSNRWKWFWVSAVLAMMCREEVGLVVASFCAVWLFFRWRAARRENDTRVSRRCWVNLLLAGAVGVGWYLISTKVIIPGSLGGDPYYVSSFFAKYGDSTGDVVKHFVRQPWAVADLVETRDQRIYFADLFAPLGFLPLLSPFSLVSSLPFLAVFAADNAGFHDIRTHYSSLILPGLFLGLVEFVRWAWRRPVLGRLVMTWLVTCAVGAAATRGPLPGSPVRSQLERPSSKAELYRTALQFVPPTGAVTTSNNFAPHLARRTTVYQFPNPFERYFYGEFDWTSDEPPSKPARYPNEVDWIVVDRDGLGKYQPILDRLIKPDGPFVVVFREGSVIVAQRRSLNLSQVDK